jgi:hypothetical protein
MKAVDMIARMQLVLADLAELGLDPATVEVKIEPLPTGDDGPWYEVMDSNHREFGSDTNWIVFRGRPHMEREDYATEEW